MRLVDALKWLDLSPPELVDNAQALEYSVRQVCAISSGQPLKQQADNSAKKQKVTAELDVDTCINSFQWKELLDEYEVTLASTKFNSRALASLSEAILMCICHLAITPSIFSDYQDEAEGSADYEVFLKQSAAGVSFLVRHVLDNAAFVNRSIIDDEAELSGIYGFSLFYALTVERLYTRQSFHTDHQGWYTIGRVLKDLLKQCKPSCVERELSASDMIATRPLAMNLEFGCNSEAISQLCRGLRKQLLSLTTTDEKQAKILIDCLILQLSAMPDLEGILRVWATKKSSGRHLNISLHQWRVIGSIIGCIVSDKVVDLYLLDRKSQGLLFPLISRGEADLHDLVFRLLGKEGSSKLLSRVVTYLSDDHIAQISSQVFQNFDAKVWSAWIVCLCAFPRKNRSNYRPFPHWDSVAVGTDGGRSRDATYLPLDTALLTQICKQVQLQMKRVNHTGLEFIALLLCAYCLIGMDRSMWQAFAALHLQDNVLHYIVDKLNKEEETIEVFGKSIGLAAALSENSLIVIKELCSESNAMNVDQLRRLVECANVDDNQTLVELCLNTFEHIIDRLGSSNVVHLSRVNLSKLPDVVLVRLFEISLKIIRDDDNQGGYAMTSKMCSLLNKKMSQYFVIIDNLDNSRLADVYVTGLKNQLNDMFKCSSVLQVDSSAAYEVLTKRLIRTGSKFERTLFASIVTAFVNNRQAFHCNPTDDAFLNMLIYFFSTFDGRVKLSNYRHPDISLVDFETKIIELMRHIFAAYWETNGPSIRDLIPARLNMRTVGLDKTVNVDLSSVAIACKTEDVIESADTAVGDLNNMSDVNTEGASDYVMQLANQEAPTSSCACDVLRDWLRTHRKEMPTTPALQASLAVKLASVCGFENLNSHECSRQDVHQELFKMLCRAFTDMLNEACCDLDLAAELIKFSPKVLGRSISERQLALAKLLGLLCIDRSVTYELWGSDNQFDFKEIMRKKYARTATAAPPTSCPAAPTAGGEDAGTETSGRSRPTASAVKWRVQGFKVLFGKWFINWIKEFCELPEEARKQYDTNFSVLLDMLAVGMRMVYASIPVVDTPGKVLAAAMERKEKDVFDSVMATLAVADKLSVYPQLCEPQEVYERRREILSQLYRGEVLAALADLLAVPELNSTKMVAEVYQIVEETLALELYREKAFQEIRREKRIRLNKLIDDATHICEHLSFIRNNVIETADGSYRVLGCVPQMCREAVRGNSLFNHIVASNLSVASKVEDSLFAYISNSVLSALWESYESNIPAICRVADSQGRQLSARSVLDTRVYHSLSSFRYTKAKVHD